MLNDVAKFSLTVRHASSWIPREPRTGRCARTVYGGHEHTLRQTGVALIEDRVLDEHQTPGGLHVLTGRVRLAANQASIWPNRRWLLGGRKVEHAHAFARGIQCQAAPGIGGEPSDCYLRCVCNPAEDGSDAVPQRFLIGVPRRPRAV